MLDYSTSFHSQVKSNHAIEEESIQTFQTTCQGNLYVFSFKHFFLQHQLVVTKSAYVMSSIRLNLFADLLAEQKMTETTCVNLNEDCTQTDEEELLEARLNEIESITEGG